MGYIKKAVDAGVQFADKYEMPGYVSKARESYKIIDTASEKIETFYCEKGSPLLDMVDDLTAAKINLALAVANKKVEQAQTLKTEVKTKVQEKTTEAIEMAKNTKATAYEKTFKAKQEGMAKYEQLKLTTSKKVDETKTILRKRAVYASEEAVRFEQKLEMKLKEKASTNEYANKVLSVVMKAKEQVKIFGGAFVAKSLSLPLNLQERWEMGLSAAKEQVDYGKAAFEAKRIMLKAKFELSKAKLSVIYTKMNSKNALTVFRSAFGEKAALYAEEKMLELKKANLKGKVTAQMTKMYKYSTFQVSKFADMANEMEGKYVGTSLVAKARSATMGGK